MKKIEEVEKNMKEEHLKEVIEQTKVIEMMIEVTKSSISQKTNCIIYVRSHLMD